MGRPAIPIDKYTMERFITQVEGPSPHSDLCSWSARVGTPKERRQLTDPVGRGVIATGNVGTRSLLVSPSSSHTVTCTYTASPHSAPYILYGLPNDSREVSNDLPACTVSLVPQTYT